MGRHIAILGLLLTVKTWDVVAKCGSMDLDTWMTLRSPKLTVVSQRSAPAISVAGAALWKQAFAFLVGFSVQFSMLIGGGAEGASATGGYGYRLLDFVALGAACLLGVYSFVPHRILPLAAYSVIVGALFLPALAMANDPRTALLIYHYILYSFAALMVAVVVSEAQVLHRFCWGLIIGLLASVPVFVLQNLGWSGALIDWGLMPGYANIFGAVARDIPRYSGLWGHPNEAGHVAALAAAAGAYFAISQRRLVPLILVAGGLLAVFYYTWCRGALIAGGIVLAIPFVVSRGRAKSHRLIVMLPILLLAVFVVSQLDFVASRFEDDANASNNIADRVASVLGGLQAMLDNPLGTSIDQFLSSVAAATGGIGSPHNGFIFFGGVLGLLPLAAFLAACMANFRVRNDSDTFFLLFTLQVSISFLFEQLPGSFPYAFAICLIGAKAFINTQFGSALRIWSVQSQRIAMTVGKRTNFQFNQD